MFDQIVKYWPNIVVNGHILHSSSKISESGKSLHAKWSSECGLIVLLSDIKSQKVIKTLMGKCLNLVLKDGPSER